MPTIFDDKKRKQAAVASGGAVFKDEYETDDHMKILQALAKEALEAMASGSSSDFARAMKAFFYECDEMPHEEGPHE